MAEGLPPIGTDLSLPQFSAGELWPQYRRFSLGMLGRPFHSLLSVSFMSFINWQNYICAAPPLSIPNDKASTRVSCQSQAAAEHFQFSSLLGFYVGRAVAAASPGLDSSIVATRQNWRQKSGRGDWCSDQHCGQEGGKVGYCYYQILPARA